MKRGRGIAAIWSLGLLLGLSTVAADPPSEDPFLRCLESPGVCSGDSDDLAPPSDAEAGEADGVLAEGASLLASVGAAIAQGATEAAEAVGAALGAVGGSVVGVLAAYAGFLVGFRPEAMPIAAYAGVAAVGTGGAAASAQSLSWKFGRRLLPWLGLLMPLFSRIEKDELLDHGKRAAIFELIRARPGIHLSEVSRELEMAWGTTLHHLRKLREQRLISIKRAGHHTCFFVNGSGYSDKEMQVLSLLKNETLAQVASAIESHPEYSLKELSRSLGISSPLAAHHVKTLEKAGLVVKHRAGKRVHMAPATAVPRGFFNEVRAHACAAEGAVGFA